MFTFTALNTFRLPEGPIFIVSNPCDCLEFSWLIDQNVEIDGKIYRVRQVNSPATATHGKGQPLALRVEEVVSPERRAV